MPASTKKIMLFLTENFDARDPDCRLDDASSLEQQGSAAAT
jgi:hypothetical protein